MKPKLKMTTEIPPSITTPDSVETRLGTLRFFDGFPDDATVQKVYDNLDFQRGVQAFLTALPAAAVSAMRKAIRTFRLGHRQRSVTWLQYNLGEMLLYVDSDDDYDSRRE